MNKVYKKEYMRARDKNEKFRNIIVGMILAIAILIFLSITLIDTLRYSQKQVEELESQVSQMDSTIHQITIDNYKLEQAVIDHKDIILDQRHMLSKDLTTVRQMLIEELSKVYYIDDLPISRVEQSYIHKMADKYNIKHSIVLGLIDLESEFDRDAIGRNKNSVDYSLFQVNSNNQKWMDRVFNKQMNLMEFYDNTDAGMYILNSYSDNNINKWLTQYNKGRGGAKKYYLTHGDYNSVYARLVLERSRKYE